MKRNKLGKVLRDLREENNLTQSQLAKKLQFTQRHISYWETGRSIPNLYEFKKIADFFCFSTDYLLGLAEI